MQGQLYAKIEGLTRLVREFEEEMSKLVSSLTTLEALPAFRAAYLKKINSVVGAQDRTPLSL